MTQQAGPEKISLDELAEKARSFDDRPLERWNPPFCGAIDMRIARNGEWFYNGTTIGRPALVRLFASILRREADGHHYLVTPVEKVKISVEDAPFLAVALLVEGAGSNRRIGLRTNLGEIVVAGPDHPIRFIVEPENCGLKPYILLRRGLEALVSRALVFDLVDLLEDRVESGRPALGLVSDGAFFALPEEAA